MQERNQLQQNMADTEWLARPEPDVPRTAMPDSSEGNRQNLESTTPDKEPVPGVGTVIDGRYRLEHQLGSGGTSSVFLAEHLSLGNLWAVKVISLQHSCLEEHLKEVELLKQLSHPMLPRVVDVVTHGNALFIVMDYVRGGNLADRIREQGPVPESEVKGWIPQLCDVLTYLHNQPEPLIYRDMKPANLIADTHGHLKLVDFGTLRRYRGGETADTAYIGTQGYAAPEQYGLGQSDPRTDLYNLGMTLFHLLTGRHPVSVPHGEIESLLLAHQVTAELAASVRKCVQLSPANRFQSAQALRDALLEMDMGAGGAAGGQELHEPPSRRVAGQGGNGLSLLRKGTLGKKGMPAELKGKGSFRVPAQASIAIMGACPGAGATFASIALASCLAARHRQMALVEMNASGDFSRFRGHLARIGHAVVPQRGVADGQSFSFGSVVYHPGCRRLTDLRGCRTDAVILDMGSVRTEMVRDEFLRADWQFVYCPQADWKFEHVLSFMEAMDQEQERNSFIYLLPQGNRLGSDPVRSFFGNRKTVSFPHVANPFEPSPSESRMMERMLRAAGLEG